MPELKYKALGIMADGCANDLSSLLDGLKDINQHRGLLGDIDVNKLNTEEVYRLTMIRLYESCIRKLDDQIKRI